jgi:hypothetical protein
MVQENQEENLNQELEPQKSKTWLWVLISVVVTGLLAGWLVFAWQKSTGESEIEYLKLKVSELEAQVVNNVDRDVKDDDSDKNVSSLIKINNLDDVKRMASEIDWEFEFSVKADTDSGSGKVDYIIKGPFGVNESVEKWTKDKRYIWTANSISFSSDNGKTWETDSTNDVNDGIRLISFFENKSGNRCDLIEKEGKEAMMLISWGSSGGYHDKTIEETKIYKGGDEGGDILMWCNKEGTLQMASQVKFNREFTDMLIKKYLENFK